MNPVYKSLVLTIAFSATVLLLLFISSPQKKTPDTGPDAVAPAPPGNADVAPAAGTKFYFDVIGHTSTEFLALLDRARMIYEDTPTSQRPDLEVVFVLHGPDIGYFAASNYDKYQNIVDFAAKLDAFDVFDFKVCAKSATSQGLAASDVPPFIEFVPYGPDEINRLETEGYVQL